VQKTVNNGKTKIKLAWMGETKMNYCGNYQLIWLTELINEFTSQIPHKNAWRKNNE
jgi:hypothetical protein